MNLAQLVAISTTLLGISFIYLASPNQQWLKTRPLTFKTGMSIGVLLHLIGWLLFRIEFSFLSSTFTSLTLSMLFLGLMPFSSRLKAPLREGIKPRAKFLSKSKEKKFKENWWLNFTPHIILALPLTLSLLGLFAWLSPGPITDSYKSQTVMWMVAPLWFTPTALAFFLPKKRITTAAYIILNILLFGLLWLTKST